MYNYLEGDIMFENLSDRLQGVIHKIKGYGKITEDNISEMANIRQDFKNRNKIIFTRS